MRLEKLHNLQNLEAYHLHQQYPDKRYQ